MFNHECLPDHSGSKDEKPVEEEFERQTTKKVLLNTY